MKRRSSAERAGEGRSLPDTDKSKRETRLGRNKSNRPPIFTALGPNAKTASPKPVLNAAINHAAWRIDKGASFSAGIDGGTTNAGPKWKRCKASQSPQKAGHQAGLSTERINGGQQHRKANPDKYVT